MLKRISKHIEGFIPNFYSYKLICTGQHLWSCKVPLKQLCTHSSVKDRWQDLSLQHDWPHLLKESHRELDQLLFNQLLFKIKYLIY